MLTDLKFLNKGEVWPPKSEMERLKMYSSNRNLFEGKHAYEYMEDLKRIERVIGNFENVISYPVILNYQKIITLKVADLLLGEQPTITCGDEGSAQQDTVDKIWNESDLWNIAYQVAIDVSRYGDGLFYIKQKNGKGKISLTQPPLWFLISDPKDIKETLNHVLAWEYGADDDKYLNIQIHYEGSYEERVYHLIKNHLGGIIGDMISSEVIRTGLNDFAVVPISNIITSDRTTGIDDYTDLDSIISELMVRVGQVSRILDKHASPSMSGPKSALEKDPTTGEWRLKAGNYFPRDTKEDPDVSYITWEGQLAASFTQIEKLINLLYTISEMGSAVFGDNTDIGAQASGYKVKMTMQSALAKVNRIRMRFDPALKKVIKLCSQIPSKGIVNLADERIEIKWEDGIPQDAKEMADIMQIRTGNKPTISQKTAIKILDNKSEEAADAELELIQADEMATNPMIAPPLSEE